MRLRSMYARDRAHSARARSSGGGAAAFIRTIAHRSRMVYAHGRRRGPRRAQVRAPAVAGGFIRTIVHRSPMVYAHGRRLAVLKYGEGH